jgi:tRNA-2-methylthio-N6-dimethylallyladenosine synthase
MTRDLIDAVADLPKVCEHINLPFQSGDDNILKRMARRYKAEHFRDLIDRIKERLPNAGLSSDVIVGFCGESEAQFERTLDMLRYVRFDVVHVAAYSPRKATPSERLWEDDVPREEKKRRLHALEQLQAQIASEKNAALESSIVEVLVEGPSDRKAANTTMGEAGVETSDQQTRWGGRTRTNKLVFFDAPYDCTGHLVKVLIDKSTPWFLEGQLLTPTPVRSRRLTVLA